MSLKRVRRVLWVLVAVAAAGSIALAWVNTRGTARKTATLSIDQSTPLLGKRLPQLDLLDLQGHRVTPDLYRGKPVLLNLWATWCVPCRAEMPELQHEARKWGAQVAIIGVDDGEDVPTIQSFVQEIGVTYTIWRAAESRIEKDLQAPGLPYSVLLDRRGVVRRVHLGQMDRQYIDDRLRELVQGSAG